jgi:hypothetical protein
VSSSCEQQLGLSRGGEASLSALAAVVLARQTAAGSISVPWLFEWSDQHTVELVGDSSPTVLGNALPDSLGHGAAWRTHTCWGYTQMSVGHSHVTHVGVVGGRSLSGSSEMLF